MTTRPTTATGAGPTGTADGGCVRLLVVRDPAGPADWSVVETLSKALEPAAPELRFQVIEAPGSIAGLAAPGPTGAWDFRVAAALGPIRPSRGDMIAVCAVPARGATVLRLRPARPVVPLDPRAPAIDGLCSLSDPPSPQDLELIALAVVAVAVMAETETDAKRTATLATLVERLALPLMRPRAPDATSKHAIVDTERAVLRAWALAWAGVARADGEALELARVALDELICHPRFDLTTRELVQLNANLAVVCLALGQAPEGARRLSEGLAACRSALHLVDATMEPAFALEMAGLRGELATVLGLKTADRQRLAEAAEALAVASECPFGGVAMARRRTLLDDVQKMLARSPGR